MLIDPIEQFKVISGASITVLGTITAWLNGANIFFSLIASIVAIAVGVATVRTLVKRLELQDLEVQLKRLEIKKAKTKLKQSEDQK